MQTFSDFISSLINGVSGFLYDPWVPLFLIAAGLYFTVRTGFIQLRLFGESLRVVSEKPSDSSSVSSFGALMVSTASRVGTGNIVGVSSAICLGGYGAVFWMWVTALLGGASAYIESTLAQIYKKRDGKGGSYGGPSYYIEAGLGQRWLGIVFALVLIFTYALGYNMLAAYNLQSTFSGYSFYGRHTPLLLGGILALLFLLCIFGGAKRLSNVTAVLVPLMGLIYIFVALVVIVINIENIPGVFSNIFAGVFDFRAIFGGFAGSAMMQGMKRGLYSNEAGMGSAPNAAATADVSHPVKQGLVQMLSVFIDTLLICTATALMCLSSGIVPEASLEGAPYVQQSMALSLGSFGPVFITISMCLFAFTTLIGNYYYCEGCIKYIFRRSPSPAFMQLFRLIATVVVFLGALLNAKLAWDTADLFQAIMVIINIPVIVILAKPALAALADYKAQRRENRDPIFKASSIGLKEKTDFWN